jgi:hypothetical protein
MDKENAEKIIKQMIELLYALQEELESPDVSEAAVLQNCPLCGGIPSLFETECGWVIRCENCGTLTLGHNTKSEIVELWNGRAQEE